MKKSLLALAALGTVPGAASAQSSLTLYGGVDNEERGTIRSLSPAGLASSRIGLRGVEDLGAGLSAGFWLENQFNPDTGSLPDASRFFGRRATVSLLGRFGGVRLGRDYTPTFWNATLFDPFGFVSVGSFSNVLAGSATPGAPNNPLGSGALTFSRADNSVGDLLPSGLGGLYGQALVAAGEGNDNNRYRGARIGCASGPLDVAAAHGRTRGRRPTTTGPPTSQAPSPSASRRSWPSTTGRNSPCAGATPGSPASPCRWG